MGLEKELNGRRVVIAMKDSKKKSGIVISQDDERFLLLPDGAEKSEHISKAEMQYVQYEGHIPLRYLKGKILSEVSEDDLLTLYRTEMKIKADEDMRISQEKARTEELKRKENARIAQEKAKAEETKRVERERVAREAAENVSMAALMSEEFVKKGLKAPATAKFPWSGLGGTPTKDYVDILGENRYRVSAWVDSQNSFGALLRTNYVCVLKYLGNDQWLLESLTFQ